MGIEDANHQRVYTTAVLVVYCIGLASFRPYAQFTVQCCDVIVTASLLILTACAGLTDGFTFIIWVVALAYISLGVLVLHAVYVFIMSQITGKSIEDTSLLGDVGGMLAERLPHSGAIAELTGEIPESTVNSKEEK